MVELLLLFASVFAASVPMATFLLMIWWLDRYEREPLRWVALIYALGATVSVGVAMIGSVALDLPIQLSAGAEAAKIAGPVLIAPLIEEPSKALVLAILLLPGARHLDGPTDGFVYGAAAGFGFATTENLLYFGSSAMAGDVGQWAVLVVLRTLWSGVMHAVATSVVGAGLGWARFRAPSVGVPTIVICLAAAMLLHATWNGLVTFDSIVGAEGGLAGIGLIVLPLAFAATFFAFQITILLEAQTLRRELLDEVQRGALDHRFALFAASWTSRAFGRPPADVSNPRLAVRHAMQLGLRKHQLRLRDGRGDASDLLHEIAHLRVSLREATGRLERP